MYIALLSMALSQGEFQQQGSMSVMKKAMRNAEQQGEALRKLMGTADAAVIQRATQPHLGRSIDLKLK